jgi:hypothetical protein
VSWSWNPTTVDCRLIKNEIARLAKKKMAEGGISSIHSRKKRATDLSGWKYKDSFIKVKPSNSRQGESHVKSNPSDSFHCFHFSSSSPEQEKLRLNTPDEFRLP